MSVTFPSRRASIVGMLLVMAATWIKPLYPAEQALHGSLTVAHKDMLMATLGSLTWLFAYLGQRQARRAP